MKLEQQVCSLEQAKRLKELEVTAPAIFYYNLDDDGRSEPDVYIHYGVLEDVDNYPAYTVAELGVMLPVCMISAKQVAHSK